LLLPVVAAVVVVKAVSTIGLVVGVVLVDIE
jgi:hypothetical protein